MLEMGITFDLAQLVLDNEIAGMIMHSVAGIPVNDETLSVDIIKELGIGKDYLSHESTYKHMKSQSQAHLMDRRMREDWIAAGSKDIYQRAHDKMIQILEGYTPPQLSDGTLADIREIVVEAEKELGVYKKG
jgi:trimethylamine---corrinoid protein Co-methyltransferase